MTTDAQTPNGEIRTDQTGPHPKLLEVIERQRQRVWQKPLPNHTREAVRQALNWLDALGCPPLILDSFCGTGLSTSTLSAMHPECAVIGIDQSSHRLAKHVRTPGQYLLLRAECEPFWRALVEAGIGLHRHTLFYPNPWPKAAHLQRRIHGHPGFASLIGLGGAVELRTNWGIYAQEFQLACEQWGLDGALVALENPAGMTLFERKYAARGDTLWQFTGEKMH